MKQVSYEGVTRFSGGQVGFVVIEHDVYFTGIPISLFTTSTARSAENVIRAIVRDMGVSWTKYTFYDVQTRTMYPFHWHGYFQVFRLATQEKNGVFRVVRREPLVMRVDSEVVGMLREQFKDYIK